VNAQRTELKSAYSRGFADAGTVACYDGIMEDLSRLTAREAVTRLKQRDISPA